MSPECQKVLIQIRPNVFVRHDLGPAVCKGYQQKTEVATYSERVKKETEKCNLHKLFNTAKSIVFEK